MFACTSHGSNILPKSFFSFWGMTPVVGRIIDDVTTCLVLNNVKPAMTNGSVERSSVLQIYESQYWQHGKVLNPSIIIFWKQHHLLYTKENLWNRRVKSESDRAISKRKEREIQTKRFLKCRLNTTEWSTKLEQPEWFISGNLQKKVKFCVSSLWINEKAVVNANLEFRTRTA